MFPGTVAEAERCWYDTARWDRWVDGLERVASVEGTWPDVGAIVTWESGPAGRGQVTERVVAYEPLSGQTLEVEDASIRGRQSVAFTPADDGVEVAFSLRVRAHPAQSRSPRWSTCCSSAGRWRPRWRRRCRAFGAELQASRTRT